ncbi:hypothetical protein ABB37_10021 [Leptomonas pyrrhocoris]|uniref:Uncharacterized protein n=1 Tax=Leptomonas pyrrhocoris TaxID=157538 RepID=A0A0N0VCS2_LEPPY|nr:hypothetical protein ABB37_10021 [Leptomonas pyrrhocoris]XP_015651772.1 hypothetical protein ABB37_10021 [Leptomonas pyrrhocoris]XP_015651773.1 hypothetical protein ABB37_10021 [Leptomonas pyrrhocoris]KPA73332.1 hypothetical protein ABB37_10021 [Leptomonas pyrrhocoris]KPA73333.1 hypothetical protein ABB37_10021 [Leptomonas pyrrhocoris]KPA73334.1 hypothetical protein ABB37_10021 [Leptomonas pyrrhocoris]|eukprot:XP_015651771.1 hypothetical protein ABB37_10021 [Leptomonas pyrrhocoris]
MNVYTSDGLLVQQISSADAQALAPEQGQQLISIYRLFLQLHHAGSGAMRIKDMLKPDAADSPGESGVDKAADRRANTARGAAPHNWSSMPEAASAYSGSIAAISSGMPYPMFLLSSNAIPEMHRLRGFPAGRPPASTAGVLLCKNNNRSCNGCEEIPLRWSLLTKQQQQQQQSTAGYGLASTGVSSNGGVDALHEKSERSPPRGSGAAADGVSGVTASARTTNAEAAGGDGVHGGATEGHTRSFASGWSAAELQVHTTHRMLICVATELPLEVDNVVEDGNSPLVFCCSVLSTAC